MARCLAACQAGQDACLTEANAGSRACEDRASMLVDRCRANAQMDFTLCLGNARDTGDTCLMHLCEMPICPLDAQAACAADYRGCFAACGGTVSERQRCVSGCPS